MKELRRIVITNTLASSFIRAVAASIPSVSINRSVNSSHSSTVVPIQIPNVFGSIVWPRSKASDEPSIRERTYDFPVRQGPQIDRTLKVFLMDLIRSNVCGTILSLERDFPSMRRNSLLAKSYSVSSGMTRGMDEGNVPNFGC